MSKMNLRSGNLLSGKSPKEQELATLEKIERNYLEKDYYNLFILITNYLGHVPYYSEHGELVYKLLGNLMSNLEKKAKKDFSEDDTFLKYVKHLKYDVENLRD